MSIATDIRGYADSAIEQGKQVLDQAQAQLSQQVNHLDELTNSLVGKFTDNATNALGELAGLRDQAEKALNIDALKAAVEPYLAQAKGYGVTLGDRAGQLVATVRSDERVGRLIAGVESANRLVQERVVRPALDVTGLGERAAKLGLPNFAGGPTAAPTKTPTKTSTETATQTTTETATETAPSAPAAKAEAPAVRKPSPAPKPAAKAAPQAGVKAETANGTGAARKSAAPTVKASTKPATKRTAKPAAKNDTKNDTKNSTD